jgi:hypothetical protein
MYTAEKGLRISRCLTVGADRYYGNAVNQTYFYDQALDPFYQTAAGSDTELYFTDWALPDHPGGHRVGPAAPAGRAFFEPLTHTLRLHNPYNLTFTNWYPATLGHEFALRRFLRAYRALPAVADRDFDGEVWPHRATLVVKWFGRTRVGIINDGPAPQRVRLTFAQDLPFGSHVTDLGTGVELSQMTVRSKTRVDLSLDAYDLAVLDVQLLPSSGVEKPRPGPAR